MSLDERKAGRFLKIAFPAILMLAFASLCGPLSLPTKGSLAHADPPNTSASEKAPAESGENGTEAKTPARSSNAALRPVPILDATTEATKRYVPVKFRTHDEHVTYAARRCERCHHDLKDGKKTEPEGCTTCHNREAATIKLPEAMHRACRGCHIEKWKEGHAGRPLYCLDCHRERP